MVHKCCISSCGMSVRVVGAKGLSYHAFPVKEPNRDKWLQAILPHVEKPEMFRIVQGYTRICSRHFKKKDYSIDSKKRARLSSSAVPSVFSGRDSSLPIKIECIEISSSATISPKEKLTPLPLAKEQEIQSRLFPDSKPVQFRTLESSFTVPFDSPITNISANDQPLPLSEDDTASSTFSSQEECYVSLPPPDLRSNKGNGKIRKRRKHRNASLPPPSNSSKKRSSASEDLNIEGVGDALAEINLSALISAASDLQHESEQLGLSSTSFDDVIGENQLLLGPGVQQRRLSKGSQQNDEEESIVASLDSFTLKKDNLDQHGFDQELLKCIQAVSIGPIEAAQSQPPPQPVTPEVDSRNPCMAPGNNDESLVSSSETHDLYADLVCGGASLSLEDSSAAIFDSQVLIEALQSVAADLEAGTSIDQLARDLSDSFLDGTLSPPMLNFDEIHVSDFDPFTTSIVLPNLGSETSIVQVLDQNTTDHPNDTKERPQVVSEASTTISKQAEPESPNKRSKEDTDSGPDFDGPSRSSSRSRKKYTRKEKSGGSFSIGRFRDSDKDIEYYTGFPTFEKFDTFFHSIDSYVENLKVTDMMHGVASIGLTVTSQESNVGETGLDRVVHDEPRRRLSQGRSMSRMDEMFMTVIRLRRKIPEKVIGHMFCISQPSVSRIIRAWTMLLSKILELQNDEKPSSGGQENPKVTVHQESSIQIGIPSSFRQLFHSELAQDIIRTGNAAWNSRKTSCSTTCPNTSRSKRPKKEKLIVVLSEPTTTTVTPEKVPTTESCPYPIPSDAGERSGLDETIGSVVSLAAASPGEI